MRSTRRHSAETLLGEYLRRLLQPEPSRVGAELLDVLHSHRGPIAHFLDVDLPDSVGRVDATAREEVCTALLEFCLKQWPLRSRARLHSYACGFQFTPLPLDGDETYAWRADGQYYVNRSGIEYFIHRNLLEFLRRDLRGFIVYRGEKGLVYHGPLCTIGDLLFTVLAAVESILLERFEQPPAAGTVHYCVPLSDVPSSLIPTVLGNVRQRREWKRLFGVSVPSALGLEIRREHPLLVVDTRHFPPAFVSLLKEQGALREEDVRGILIHGDNLDAMRLLLASHRGNIRCVYVDPPYNTGTSNFLYRDRYRRSDWLTMMDNRLELAQQFLRQDGSIFVQIDYAEKERLRLLLDRYFTYQTEIIWRIGWISGFKAAANKFIRNHDTIYHYARSPKPFFKKSYIPYPAGYTRRDGSPPSGKGYPLEDTWNCSEIDRLDSIQIMSFSREKVGAPALTQKNENLLARIIGSTTLPGDTVMDFFAGTGTTCAVAHKMGRRWIGIERGDWFLSHTLPRMKRVLSGDPHGVSRSLGWKGGGAFCYMEIFTPPDSGNE